jgi:hypothetical protein
MQRILRGLTAGAAILAMVGLAWGGQKGSWPVTVSTSYRYAQGGLGTARNSVDNNQLIGCNTRASGSGSSAGYWSYCYAEDAAGNFGSCYTASDAIAATIRGVNGDSAVYFDWDASGYCGTVIIYEDSSLSPK